MRALVAGMNWLELPTRFNTDFALNSLTHGHDDHPCVWDWTSEQQAVPIHTPWVLILMPYLISFAVRGIWNRSEHDTGYGCLKQKCLDGVYVSCRLWYGTRGDAAQGTVAPPTSSQRRWHRQNNLLMARVSAEWAECVVWAESSSKLCGVSVDRIPLALRYSCLPTRFGSSKL